MRIFVGTYNGIAVLGLGAARHRARLGMEKVHMSYEVLSYDVDSGILYGLMDYSARVKKPYNSGWSQSQLLSAQAERRGASTPSTFVNRLSEYFYG